MSKKFIVMCGLPGSGKSTYANKNYPLPWIIICGDDYRKAFSGKDFDPASEHRMFPMIRTSVEAMLMRYDNVVLDMVCLGVSTRKTWIEIAHKYGALANCGRRRSKTPSSRVASDRPNTWQRSPTEACDEVHSLRCKW